MHSFICSQISMRMTDRSYFRLMSFDVDYFNNIPKQLKTLEVYYALLNGFAHAKLVEKAGDVMQKMRDLGFSRTPLSYNILLDLYYQMETLTNSMF
ncbi:pentatricopeptide repeat-containing protein [Pyrus ussuriensis x Pyrus communis]|uniref:Pentatricopeptide repeat-containing protein n=1 Tax=Pyrus ussuriensis x Pyrus communis TaxID=2448454 RepID=A0A5N5G3M2_9ROSA|nr:pentatricopeptide repeat-containing protein [Pyrus ussuriensis x Pyrus communis]